MYVCMYAEKRHFIIKSSTKETRGKWAALDGS